MIFWRKNKDDKAPKGKQTPLEPAPAPNPASSTEPEAAAPPPVSENRAGPITENMAEEATPVSAPPAAAPAPIIEEPASWLGRLSRGLSKSTAKFTQGLGDLLTKRKLDQDMLDELEELLITADLGPKTAAKLVAEFGRDRFGKDVSGEEVAEALAASIAQILAPVTVPLDFARPATGPQTILVCGVNGVGKTTTIGKIAYEQQQKYKRNIWIAAGDTFRAAAVEQLAIWAKRAGCSFFAKDLGADSAAVAYESYEKAIEANADLLMIDTAGRLHNKANLMQELEKIVRVLKKKNADIPHQTLLVLDATTGQNAIEQVRIFRDMVNITGLIVTKLDGSAKGGIVVALADQFGLPIHYIGVGEGQEDLQPFDPVSFARSLVGLSTHAA